MQSYYLEVNDRVYCDIYIYYYNCLDRTNDNLRYQHIGF